MYGTIARFRVKAGMADRMQADMRSYESLSIPGYVDTIVYQMDTDPNEYYLAVVFADKDAYEKNANDPAQDARYQEMMTYMDGEPEWHDGEIVYQARK
jgi:quinol monooxygenase YgiN